MWLSGCRTRSGIVLEDEVLTIFIPGLDLIPSGVHPEDACRVCRCVPSVAYTTVVAVHKQSSKNIPEGCVDGTRPCTEGKRSPIRRVELGTHLAASPCGGIVHLSGAVWTQPGEWAPAFTSWRLTIWPGEGDEEAFEIVRGQTGIVNHGKQVMQLFQMLMLFP